MSVSFWRAGRKKAIASPRAITRPVGAETMSSRASTHDFPLASTALLGLQAQALALPLVQVCAQILRDSCAWGDVGCRRRRQSVFDFFVSFPALATQRVRVSNAAKSKEV
jgi:hypothetical protein